MVIQKEVQNLIKQLAKEYDLPFDVVRNAVFYQFKYVKGEIGEGVKGDYNSFKNILLRYLGTFYASKAKIEKIEELKNKKKDA